ncbi:hypothetical protein [Nonomuraea sp. NPDC049400]|uniref:hypothetical protein n=1 Tax=Nonomuraea sp. NPDC049400 TaxID=3364352 RepID=UPI0037983302
MPPHSEGDDGSGFFFYRGPSRAARYFARLGKWQLAAVLISLTFLVGEFSALLALAHRWFYPSTFYLTAGSIAMMGIYAVIAPIIRWYGTP